MKLIFYRINEKNPNLGTKSEVVLEFRSNKFCNDEMYRLLNNDWYKPYRGYFKILDDKQRKVTYKLRETDANSDYLRNH